jgi:hypothetical protein
VPLTHIPEEQWEEVTQRHANGESLRLLAKSYGVSHEAVRQVLGRCRSENGEAKALNGRPKEGGIQRPLPREARSVLYTIDKDTGRWSSPRAI